MKVKLISAFLLGIGAFASSLQPADMQSSTVQIPSTKRLKTELQQFTSMVLLVTKWQ